MARSVIPPKKGQSRFWDKIQGPRTQPSLFHYIKEEQEASIWSELDFRVLRHPLRFLREELRPPHTQPSLFHYVLDESELAGERLSWKQLLKDLIFDTGSPLFVSSVYSDPEQVAAELVRLRSRRNRARAFSLILHFLAFLGALVLFRQRVEVAAPQEKETIVFLNSPIILPFEIEGRGEQGGGGGGGGKQEPTPSSGGRLPEMSKVQLVAPDPMDPQPLIPAEDLLQAAASVVMPIELPQDETLPIGDVEAPPSDRRSSGPGTGGGIGAGSGTGIGSGTGPGVGPGSGGGMGGGSGGGIGSGVGPGIGPYIVGGGVREPTLIYKTLPKYTEEARKNRVEGIVLLEVVVRANGTVDNAKVLRGLGFGLDESALREVVTKWKFKPGTLNGRPVDVQALIEVSFRLL